jgi:hypothetical protein
MVLIYNMAHLFSRRFSLYLLCGLILINIPIYEAVSTPPRFEVTVLAVGKGQATLVRSSRGKTLLINTGADASILRALGSTLPEWQRTIDGVLLTSTKNDAAGGLPSVMSHYTVLRQITLSHDEYLIFDKTIVIDVLSPTTVSIRHGTDRLTIGSSTPESVSY